MRYVETMISWPKSIVEYFIKQMTFYFNFFWSISFQIQITYLFVSWFISNTGETISKIEPYWKKYKSKTNNSNRNVFTSANLNYQLKTLNFRRVCTQIISKRKQKYKVKDGIITLVKETIDSKFRVMYNLEMAWLEKRTHLLKWTMLTLKYQNRMVAMSLLCIEFNPAFAECCLFFLVPHWHTYCISWREPFLCLWYTFEIRFKEFKENFTFLEKRTDI